MALFHTLLRRLRAGAEGLFVLLCLPGLLAAACLGGAGWAGVRRAGPRWRRLIRRGWRDLRDRWWLQGRLESASCMGRYVLLAEAAELMRPPARGPVDRVLLLRLGHIGDILHAVPAVRAFRARQPGTPVDILVGPWAAGLARTFDCFDDVVVYGPRVVQFNRGVRGHSPGLLGEWSFLRTLSRRGYGVIVSAAPLHFCEMAVLNAVKPRAFWGVAPEAPLYPASWETEETRPFDSRMYEADWVGACFAPAGIPAGPFDLEYPLAKTAREKARGLLRDAGIVDGARYAVLAPGAGWPGKQWPAERFAGLGDWLSERPDWRIVVAGSSSERALCEEVRRRMRAPAVNLGGRTDLDELAAVLAGAALFVGNDSGPMHIAAAVGTPTITFWGPTFPEKWAPRGPRHLVVRPASPCAGCVYWHPRAVCTGAPPCIETAPFDPSVVGPFVDSLQPRP